MIPGFFLFMLRTNTLLHHQFILPLMRLVLLGLLFWLPLALTVTIRAADMTTASILELVNADRRATGLESLTLNETLSTAAQAKLDDMFERGYFAHTSPSGETPWYWVQQSGYSYQYAGENLAINYATAEKQHAAWMGSPTHRANVLNSQYQETGIAVRNGKMNGETVTITVELFGAPRAVAFSMAPKTARASETSRSALQALASAETLGPQLLPERSLMVLTWLMLGSVMLLTLVIALGPALFIAQAFKTLSHAKRAPALSQ